MVERVTFEKSTFKGLPEKYEAGTPNISGAIGLAAAFDYLETLGWEAISAHEHALLEAANDALFAIPKRKVPGRRARESLGGFVYG